MEKISRKKINLPQYQEMLIKKFAAVGEDSGYFESHLGLVEEIAGMLFFFPLNQLRRVTINQLPESIHIVNDWIVGFTQMLGDVYTVIDLERVLNHVVLKYPLTKKIINYEAKDLTLIFLKEEVGSYFSVKVNELNLIDSKKQLTLVEKNDYQNLNALNLINRQELFLIKRLMGKPGDISVFNEDIAGIGAKLLVKKTGYPPYIKDVYIDKKTMRPVFVFDLERGIKLLSMVSAYERV